MFAQVCQLGLAGDSTNRWFDKSLSYIVFQNGLAASNCDVSTFQCFCFEIKHESDVRNKWFLDIGLCLTSFIVWHVAAYPHGRYDAGSVYVLCRPTSDGL